MGGVLTGTALLAVVSHISDGVGFGVCKRDTAFILGGRTSNVKVLRGFRQVHAGVELPATPIMILVKDGRLRWTAVSARAVPYVNLWRGSLIKLTCQCGHILCSKVTLIDVST